MTGGPFDELQREARAIPEADVATRERVWRGALAAAAPPRRLARLWRARVLVPLAAAYLVAVPIGTALAVGSSDSPPGLRYAVDTRYQGVSGWQTLDKHCPKPSKGLPLRACVAFSRTAGRSALYLNGVAPQGTRRITIRFADRTKADARIQKGVFLLTIPLKQQAWASDARVTVTAADGTVSRTLALADLIGDPGFGYRVEHDYRRNNPCPPAGG
jgi:hypothetical protein